MPNKFADLIAFNETCLDASITDGMIHLNDYDLIRSRNGGGVCIYLRSSIDYKIRDDLVPAEAVCIGIIKPYSKPFLVSTVYRPPNASSEFFLSQLMDEPTQITMKTSSLIDILLPIHQKNFRFWCYSHWYKQS